MSQLIDDLLNLSRIGRGDVQRLNVDLSALVAEIAARLSEASGRRDIRLEVEDGVNTVGDPRLLAIALENLLNNAFKFSRHRQIPVIRFYTTTRDGQTVFYVSDNGAGFDMRYQHKLFAPFQRLHLDDEFEGTGIGLVTVARIVDRHAGKVWIEGSQDQGATVSVFIPSTSTL
jgi:signal transduction histidine kinase